MTSRSRPPKAWTARRRARERQLYRETYDRKLAELKPEALPKYAHIAGPGWAIENIQLMAAGVVDRLGENGESPTLLEYKEFRVYLRKVT